MSQYFTQHQIQDGVVLPHVLNRCPKGTKVHVLPVGFLQADEGFMIRGGNTSLMSAPDGPAKNKRRDLVMYVVLIDHPSEGLILFETGCGKDYPEVSDSAALRCSIHRNYSTDLGCSTVRTWNTSEHGVTELIYTILQ